jgi:D-amino-acid dehydrogenase
MQRAWQLHRLSQGLFRQDLSAQDATPWMGFRPSLPDSLPIIDRVCEGKVLLAFGHQHLGLTQAAVTAEWVAQLASTDRRGRSCRRSGLIAWIGSDRCLPFQSRP